VLLIACRGVSAVAAVAMDQHRHWSADPRGSWSYASGGFDLFVGVLVQSGARGVEQIVQIKRTAEENAALQKSAGAVKELVDVIKV